MLDVLRVFDSVSFTPSSEPALELALFVAAVAVAEGIASDLPVRGERGLDLFLTDPGPRGLEAKATRLCRRGAGGEQNRSRS